MLSGGLNAHALMVPVQTFQLPKKAVNMNHLRDNDLGSRDTNPDWITGESDSHPVGTGLGAGAGALSGAAIGTAVAGLISTIVGTIVSGVIGAVSGGLASKAVAEGVDPTFEGAPLEHEVGLLTP